MICRFYRWLISKSLDEERPLSPRIRKHIDSCAGCRKFSEFSSKLADRLKREAADVEAPDTLHTDLMAKIREMEQPASIPRSAKRFPVGMVAAAVVVALIAAAIFIASRLTEPQVVNNRRPIVPVPALEQPEIDPGLPWEVVQIEEQAAQLDEEIAAAAEESYQTELENLKDDLKSAADFVLAGAEI